MNKGHLSVFKETPTLRVAVSGVADEGRRIEVLLQALPCGPVDLKRLHRISELLGWLSFQGFALVHEEGGWISGERAWQGTDPASEIGPLLEAVSAAGLD